MKTNYVTVMIAGLILCCGLTVSSSPFQMTDTVLQTWGQHSSIAAFDGEVIDQQQPHNGTFGFIGVVPLLPGVNISLAQSFIPQKQMLTHIAVQIGKNATTTSPYMIAIRSALQGDNIAVSFVPAEEILTENFSWVSFRFENVKLTVNETYWMVCYTANVTDNFYVWLANSTNPYPNGTVAISFDDGQSWTNETTVDMTFITYGLDATELDLTLRGGLGIHYTIRNIGAVNATGVQISLQVTGGIFDMINITEDGIFASPLPPYMTIGGRALPLGLGPIQVTMSVRAGNALEVTKTADGFVLFFFVILQ
ncbi:MAG: hypothetical protein JW840_08635 [Candidatus Thermoplasmatota archaeon]|nr:hypothetical protein [Candidatus Thermoplasmatota archaeon]